MSKRGRDEFPAVVDDARRAYNRPCSNKPSLDAKGGDRTKELVAKKTADYCACFTPSAKVYDLVSGKPILGDAQTFRTRFGTVFRESGTGLELAVRARAFYLQERGAVNSYILDLERPSLDKLERYVERMYDGPEAATQATYMVLQLARSPENLEALLQTEALLGLLSRLLQEEARNSMDLAINIIYILYSFSNFSQFHQVLYQSRVGDNVLKVVDFETKRHALHEHEKKKKAADPEHKQDAAEEKRHRLMMRKQEKLLYVCFHVLLNLAEEPDIERKMTKRDIVGYLVGMLTRQNAELLVLVLLFLKKVSVFKENLPALREKKLVAALVPFVPHTNDSLLGSAAVAPR